MRFFAVFSESKIVCSAAPLGRKSIAQGNALGFGRKKKSSPEGAAPKRGVSPFQGFNPFPSISQGVALGYLLAAPLGLPIPITHPTENSEEP
jgi:hypothetical protein